MPDELREIDPRELGVLEERATAAYDDGQREALRESIRLEGIRVPLDVYEMDGALVVADGLNRAAIAIELGLETVPCRVRQGTEQDAMLWNLTANHVRGKNKPGEMARLVLKLRADHGLEPTEISARTGLSRSWIAQLLQLERACGELLRALDAGTVSLGVALEICAIDDVDAQMRTLFLAREQAWTIATARTMVPEIQKELQKPAVEQVPIESVGPPLVECQICHHGHPPNATLGTIVCHACWGLAVSSVREIHGALEAPPP